MQVNDVHGTHGQTGTVDHAADVAFQSNVVQFELGSVGFTRIVLRRIVHGAQLGLTVHGVAVDVDLGIQAVQVAVFLDHQRVDFQQRQVVVGKQFAQAYEDVGELLDLVAFQAQLERQLTALVRLRADQRVDGGFQNFLGSFFRDFLDLDTTFGGCHEHDATGRTINYSAQVQFLGDVGAGLNQDLADRLTIGVSLVSDQTLTQPLLGEGFCIFLALDQLDTASLTTATSVNLSLDDPHVAANLFTGLGCFFRSVYSKTLGDRKAVLSEQLLPLIFVKIHAFLPF